MRCWIFLLFCSLTLLASLAEPVERFPGGSWDRGRPNDLGFDEAKLKAAVDYPFSLPLSQTYCVSVHRNGLLIADRYAEGVKPNDPNIIWSTSKAVMITMIGMLERQGKLRRTDKIVRYIPEWKGTPAEDIILDHILRMESGRYYDLINDFVVSQFQPSQTNFSIGLNQQHPPGTVDQYNQMAFQILQRVFKVAVPEQHINDWFKEHMMRPLEWQSESFWQEESFFIPVPNDPLVYGGLHTSCLDLARFGHLWLHKGRWRASQLFSEDFWTDALEKAPPPRAGRRYHWGGGPNHKASGMGGQFVVFNREKDLVITRVGDPIGLGWRPADLIDRVMDSLLDGPGSWDAAQDAIENPAPKEEEQFSYILRELGGLEGLAQAYRDDPEAIVRAAEQAQSIFL